MRRALGTRARFGPLLAAFFWVGSAQAAKIACVGDSITYGYGLGDPSSESYPAQLQALVGADHEVGNFGVSGATLLKSGDRPYWNESRFADSDAFAPEIVIVMLGTNDAKPQNWANSAAFSADYLDLIEHYRALGAVVYVATPPRVFEPGAFDISASVVENEVAPLVEQIALEADAPWVDVFEATSESGDLFPDTVHPNAAGAQVIAEAVASALEQYGFDEPGDSGSGDVGTASGGAGGASTSTAGGAGGGSASTTGGASVTSGADTTSGAGATSSGDGGETTDGSTSAGTVASSVSGGATTLAGANTSSGTTGATTAFGTSAGGAASSATSESSGSESDGSLETSTSTGNVPHEGGGENQGCGCELGAKRGTSWQALAWGLLALVGLRRRRD